MTLRVRHEDGQGVVRGLDPGNFRSPFSNLRFQNYASSGDSVEKLLSHSLEVLGVQQIDMDGVKMLSGWLSFIHQDCKLNFSGFPPKPLDISDRDRSIDSLGVRNGDTIIFQNLKPSTTSEPSSNPSNSNSSSSSSSSSCPPPAPSLSKAEGPSEAKRKKTEVGAPRMERQVLNPVKKDARHP